jgi:DNA-binding response OmpR family regulator
MTGEELIQQLHRVHASIPVILTTGSLPAAESQPSGVLFKPYNITELVEMVKAVLGANASATGTLAPPPNWQIQPLSVGRPYLRKY